MDGEQRWEAQGIRGLGMLRSASNMDTFWTNRASQGLSWSVLAALTKIPWTECLNNERQFISHSSRDWEVHDQAPADLMSGESPSLFLLCPHMEEGMRELCKVAFIKH